MCQFTPNSSPSPRGEDKSAALAVSDARAHLHGATRRLKTGSKSLEPPACFFAAADGLYSFLNSVLTT